jgi:hypothetical protein
VVNASGSVPARDCPERVDADQAGKSFRKHLTRWLQSVRRVCRVMNGLAMGWTKAIAWR